MYTVRNNINKAMMRAYIHAIAVTTAAKSKLREQHGSFFTEHAMAIVITVVVAAIVIAAVVLMFRAQIFPRLEDSVDDFFNIV